MAASYDDIYKEHIPNIATVASNKLRKICQPKTLKKKLPFLEWLPKYKRYFLLRDCLAGITVGLTTIPQAIAYGVVAGLEPQYGLYSAFMGCFAYIFFGSCKDVTIATTAIMALMVHDYAVMSPDYAVLISFLVGCIIVAFGLLNLGVLVRFISMPVITGFTMAAATTIGSAQINNLFGMKAPSNSFIPSWEFFFTHITKSLSWTDSALGISSLLFLLLMTGVQNHCYGPKMFWKYFSLSRNALVVLVGILLAYYLSHDGYEPFRVTGNITSGLPPFGLPPFTTTVNGTFVSTSQMLNTIKGALLSTPLVATLEIMAISKAFAQGKVVDASQELIALGMCNILGSFVLSMPVTGSFTRTAVNHASGVRTPLGGAFTGALVLLALALLTSTFYYIPKATLASIIIAAMISLVDFKSVGSMWIAKKLDLLPFLVTFLTGLFWSLEYGILIGVATNTLFILFNSARPQVVLKQLEIINHQVCVVNVKQRLDYASAEYVREKVLKHVNEDISLSKLVIILGEEINSIDYTVAMNIISLKKDLDMNKIDMICLNWNYSAAGVICRLNADYDKMFKYDSTIGSVVHEYFQSRSSSESTSTLTSA